MHVEMVYPTLPNRAETDARSIGLGDVYPAPRHHIGKEGHVLLGCMQPWEVRHLRPGRSEHGGDGRNVSSPRRPVRSHALSISAQSAMPSDQSLIRLALATATLRARASRPAVGGLA